MSAELSDDTLGWLLRVSHDGSPPPWRAWVEGRDHTSGDSFIQIGPDDQRGEDMYVSRDSAPASAQDLDLIAAARNYLPMLVDELLRLRKLSR
ncbi:MAG TPA: hypothetical protein VGM75_19605 [Pseudonocardiaceae bacterium]